MFKAVARVVKKVLRNPIVRAIIQIIACNPLAVAATFGGSCVAAAAGMTLAAGGSISDALIAAALAFAQVGGGAESFFPGIWSAVGEAVAGAHAIIQSTVHGVVSGAISMAQGGNFLQGFAGGFIGKMGGIISNGMFGNVGGWEGFAARTAIAAGFGCAGAAASGGKCVNGAVTAAFANLYNHFGGKVHSKRGKELGSIRRSGASKIHERLWQTPYGEWRVVKIGGYTGGLFEGIRVYMKDALICLYCVDKFGRTSLVRMQAGRAPLGYDNLEVNLHHWKLRARGPFIELDASRHRLWGDKLHGYVSRSRINRPKFDAYRERYWRRRATMFEK